MFLTAHTSAALLIATKITNPFLGLVLGILSHFILDFIPHGEDGAIANKAKTHKSMLMSMFYLALVDILIASIFLCIFFWQYQPDHYLIFFVTVFGSWLPDLAWGSVEMFKLKTFNWVVILHHKIHDLLDITYSIKYGLILQAAFIALMLFLIWN